MASSNSALLLLVLVALAGLADLQVAARPVDAAGAKHPVTDKADPDLDGMMQCMIGCISTVMSCAFGCMRKGPDLPLCVITCNQKSIVCMIRCGFSPSPPGPKPPAPPAPTPSPPAPAPKPPSPKPAPTPKPPKPAPTPKPPKPAPTPKPPAPAPGPPYTPPYAAYNTETSV